MYFQRGTTALEAFEILEQNANDSSFCSTSSMVAQLMEDSIKSTPIKTNEGSGDEDRPSVILNSIIAGNECEDTHTFHPRCLNVILEEQSKLEDSSKDESKVINSDDKIHEIILNNTSECRDHEDYSEQFGSSECSSECSCCQDSHYMSKSVSVFAEETTTVYSPAKKESSRKFRYFKSDNVCYDPQFECTQPDGNDGTKDDETNDELLKSLLPQRLKELEIEIDAFRNENSYLNKLRNNYEKEYNKFCEEKAQLLGKIRSEHLQGVKEIEEEKKQLQREKLAFEKYMKEARNRPNKEEKEEIRLLKEEVYMKKWTVTIGINQNCNLESRAESLYAKILRGTHGATKGAKFVYSGFL